MSLILSGTDGVSDIDGTAATPAIRGTDADTGIYFPTANQVAITTGGTVAAAFDSNGLFFRNRIINGAMVIDQRNAGASVTPADGAYTLDRWSVYQFVASKFSVQQNAGAVTPPTGFSNYLGVTSLSAYTVLSGGANTVQQAIEGFNTADLAWGTANAQAVTLSFWVRSSLTGTFGGAVQNSAANRSYPFSFAVSAASTWEYKTITIPGDTTGTWVGATNGVGLRVFFGLGVGSTYSGTAGAWAGSQLFSATGAVSVVGTNGATFYITGVQLEVGSVATPFERRPYGTELMLCQRYYEQIGGSTYTSFGVGFNFSTTQALSIYYYKVTKRIVPTLTTTGTAANYEILQSAGATALSAVPTISSANSSPQHAFLEPAVASGLTAGQGSILRAVSPGTAYLGYSAEL